MAGSMRYLAMASGWVAATSSMSMPPIAEAMMIGRLLWRSTVIERYSSLTMSTRCSIQMRLAISPLMFIPRIAVAGSTTSRSSLANLMPPALPRPPISTCALTTLGAGLVRIIATASSTVCATLPAGTGMPAAANSSLPWYSSSFIVPRSPGSRARDYSAALSRDYGAAYGKRSRREREWAVGPSDAELVAQTCGKRAAFVIRQRRGVRPGRALAEQKGRPIVFERRKVHLDREIGGDDVCEPRLVQQRDDLFFRERSRAFAESDVLALGSDRSPEDVEHVHAVAQVPQRRRDRAAGPDDAVQRGKRAAAIRDEIEDQLAQRAVEGIICKAQRREIADFELELRRHLVAPCERHVCRRRVDADEFRARCARGDGKREIAGARSDVENAVAVVHLREIEEQRRELRRPAPHETLVGGRILEVGWRACLRHLDGLTARRLCPRRWGGADWHLRM